jgi:hypothetical protein
MTGRGVAERGRVIDGRGWWRREANELMKTKVKAASQFCLANLETILSVLIFAAAFVRALAESERHPRR